METEIQSATEAMTAVSQPVESTNILENASNTFMSAIQNTPKIDHYAGQLSYIEILIALTTAAILGALIAYHPKRNVEAIGQVSDKELKKTQILIAVSGAIMVALIQGSLERAFGLVGLGAFIRYRTALRNPVDLSIIFLLIGLGMACGLQYYHFAITITGFIYVLLYILELEIAGTQKIWSVKVDTNFPVRVEKAFKELAQQHKFHIVRLRSSRQGGAFRCKFVSKSHVDTDMMTQKIQDKCGEDMQYSRFEWVLERE